MWRLQHNHAAPTVASRPSDAQKGTRMPRTPRAPAEADIATFPRPCEVNPCRRRGSRRLWQLALPSVHSELLRNLYVPDRKLSHPNGQRGAKLSISDQ
ncbi:hypothetical protein HPB50_001000 [Hyalomma asiaticum]|uniref:Uncharacterized protein n=1 Tax=Hyalomma asiaticum TaxID=266040 RepID=A0ACB7SLG7_HYAAI|nr:hypothetical protein HPB50_001000 [Hyalomma asiaticum]